MSESIDRDILLVVEAYQTWVRVFDKYGPIKSHDCRRRYFRRWGRLHPDKRDEAMTRMERWLEENPGEG